MDNGTAAWGQVSDAPTTWGDPDDSGKASGWGTPSPNANKAGKNAKKNVENLAWCIIIIILFCCCDVTFGIFLIECS